ncbi:MAG: efflux RND transporter periplasmic adaptor subunit [Steroidobacteraceae bacterium]
MSQRLAWILAAGAGLASMPLTGAEDGAAAVSDVPSVLVQTTALKKGSLPRIVVAYGTVQAKPSAYNSVTAPGAAIVADVFVRVGQTVAAGDRLVELTPTPPARAAYAAAVSAQGVASDALTRTRQLRADSLATEQQLAAAAKADSDARAALAALRAQGAAGATTLRAASAAIVTAVAARTHAIVAEGAPLLELAQRSGLVLVAGVVPAQASAITAGDRAEVTPIGATGTVVARVMLRGAAVDPGNGLVPVEVALPAGALLPGESAQAAITTGVVNGYVVPHSAVLVTDNGATYIVQDVHGTARTVAVRVLLSAGETDAVDGPLDGSAPLILAGAYQLHDGMKVRLADAAAQGR